MRDSSPGSAPAPEPSLREYLSAALFSVAVTAGLFGPTWGRALFVGDLFRWAFPGITFYRQSLLSGEWPLWSPYLSLGYPFLAEMANAVLYPVSALHLFFSVPAALKVYPAVHYALTGFLMWRLLRLWRLDQAGALFGALAWMASGYLVSLHRNLNYLVPAAWYPALLFCGHRLLRERRLKWLAATALVWALIFLGGDPQAFLFAGVLLFLYAGFGSERATTLRRPLTLALMAGALAPLIVLAQLLPSLELGNWTTKLGGFNFAEAADWSFHPLRLLELVWPGLWGSAFSVEQPFWAGFLSGRHGLLWASAVDPGLLPLGLALAQTRRFRDRPTGFLVLTLLLFFLLALGAYSPLYRLVWTAAPWYRIFRYPEKHLAVAAFALSGLAAFGFQRLVAPGQATFRGSFSRAWIILTGFLIAVFAALLLGSDRLAVFLARSLPPTDGLALTPSIISAPMLHAAARAAAVAAVIFILFQLAPRVAGVQRQLALLLLLLTAEDLLSLARGQIITADPALFTSTPPAARIIRRDQEDPQERFRIFRSPSISIPQPLAEPRGRNETEKTYFWWRDTLLGNTAVAEGLEEVFGYDPAKLGRLHLFSLRPLEIGPLQMLNVKYLLDGIEPGRLEGLPQVRSVGQVSAQNLNVLRNNGYLPRAYFVDGIYEARDDAQCLDFLAVADFKKNVVLVRPASGARVGKVMVPARIPSYQNRQVKLEVENPVSGYLVLSDSYFPGWQALVDGSPVRILRANYLVRAVALEPGSHRVVFTYRPWPWRVGATASLVSLLGVALLVSWRTVTVSGARCHVSREELPDT